MTALLERVVAPVRPVLERFVEVGSIQSAIVIAAQALMAVFPLLIGVVAYAPQHVGDTISTFMRERMGSAATPPSRCSNLSTRATSCAAACRFSG